MSERHGIGPRNPAPPRPMPPIKRDYVVQSPTPLGQRSIDRLPSPSKPNLICRSGWCCDTRPCRTLELIALIVFVLLCIGAVALVIFDGQTTGYGLD